MTDLLSGCITQLLSRAQTAGTIGQEHDSSVGRANDPLTHRWHDSDLVLLDETEIGHADRDETGAIWKGNGLIV